MTLKECRDYLICMDTTDPLTHAIMAQFRAGLLTWEESLVFLSAHQHKRIVELQQILLARMERSPENITDPPGVRCGPAFSAEEWRERHYEPPPAS